MSALSIDADDLVYALTTRFETSDAAWYLDRETGDVLLDHEASEDLPEDFGDDPRYLYIEPMPAHLAYEVMADFVATLPGGPLAKALDRALQGRKPFRHFKDVLLDYPAERVAWFKYSDAENLGLAEAWCRDHGIEPIWRARRTQTPE